MQTSPPGCRLTVDGEVFEVRPSEHQHGFDFDWISGPNPGYGFSCSVPMVFTRSDQPVGAAPAMDDQALVAHIRSFLQQIDPATGYIAD